MNRREYFNKPFYSKHTYKHILTIIYNIPYNPENKPLENKPPPKISPPNRYTKTIPKISPPENKPWAYF